MTNRSVHQPLWIPLWDAPDAPRPSEEDVLAEKYRAANEAAIAEVEILDDTL